VIAGKAPPAETGLVCGKSKSTPLSHRFEFEKSNFFAAFSWRAWDCREMGSFCYF
jgi:hypothetical protein